jgi:hypothetical protein
VIALDACTLLSALIKVPENNILAPGPDKSP